MTNIFKIDTKGACLLCLCDCEGESLPSTSTSFRMLLRYLKIDITEQVHFASSFSPLLSGSDSAHISVSLCDGCSSVTNHFLQLFQDFERIRIELDNCAGKLYQAIDEGEKFATCVRKYRHLLTGTGPVPLVDALNASIAEKMRKVTLVKCARRLKTSSPRILVKDEILLQTAKVSSEEQSRQEVHRPISESQRIPSTEKPLNQSHDPMEVITIESDNDEDETTPVLIENQPQEVGNNTTPKFKKNLKKKSSIPDAPSNINIHWAKLPNGTSVCRLCGKICDHNFSTFREHYMKLHYKSNKCSYCPRVYHLHQPLGDHLVTAHPILHLSDKLPPNTTDDELKEAVESVTQKWETVADQEFSVMSNKCHLCEKKCGGRGTVNLKAHILQSHLDEVLHELTKMRTERSHEEPTSIEKTASSVFEHSHENPGTVMEVDQQQHQQFMHEEHTEMTMPPENPEMKCDESYADGLQQLIQDNSESDSSDEEGECINLIPKDEPLLESDFEIY